jgi:RNA polymerase sigma-54 factor
MGMEMRQELRLSQQLVMTPQLQQAIRLLQLSRMELSELVHEEMLENPILEDDLDREMERDPRARRSRRRRPAERADGGAGTTELAVDQPIGENNATSEVKGDDSRAVTEIDWENYLDGQSLSGGHVGAARGRRRAAGRGGPRSPSRRRCTTTWRGSSRCRACRPPTWRSA